MISWMETKLTSSIISLHALLPKITFIMHYCQDNGGDHSIKMSHLKKKQRRMTSDETTEEEATVTDQVTADDLSTDLLEIQVLTNGTMERIQMESGLLDMPDGQLMISESYPTLASCAS